MKSYRLPLVVTQPNTKPLLSDMCSGAVDRSRTVCRCLPPATRDATREVSRQIQVIQWSQKASSSERLTVRTRLTMDVCVSRAVDRSETVLGCLGRVVEYPRRVLYVHMYLLSGRPLRDSVRVSTSGGRVSKNPTVHPHAPLERSTAQRQGSGVYLPRLARQRRTCAVYGGAGKVLLRPNAGDH